jgi:hypothetical protein
MMVVPAARVMPVTMQSFVMVSAADCRGILLPGGNWSLRPSQTYEKHR